MKVQIEIEIQPFAIPKDVVVMTRKSGADSGVTLPLSQLDGNTLDALCNKFRRTIFEQTGKQEPPKAVCSCGVER